MTKYTIIEQSDAVAEYVARRVGLNNFEEFGPCFSLGVASANKPVAGLVFNWFRNEKHGNDVRVTIAAETRIPWAREPVLKQLFDYPFNKWGCARVTAIIKEGNESSVKFCRHLGFRKEGVLRRAWDGKTNAMVFGLLKHECRYL